MAFCKNCGQQLAEDSKFCHKCGTPVVQNEIRNETERKTVYDGEIHKCPNCGAVLDSFTAVCPQCGFELRGAKATNSVREFALKLEEIESKRLPNEKRNSNVPNEIDEQKINLICNFPIPNTKEDLYEFFYLAKSNIDLDAYKNRLNNKNIAISDAWMIKLEQAYNKLGLLFSNETEFMEIQSVHDSTCCEVNKAKNHLDNSYKKFFKIMSILFIVLISLSVVLTKTNEQKENARLETIVSEVEETLEIGEYKLALMYAETIKYGEENENLKQEWNIKREYLIDKILKEAAENGVVLEYTPSKEYGSNSETDLENTETETKPSSGFISGFVSGFNEALDSHKNSDD